MATLRVAVEFRDAARGQTSILDNVKQVLRHKVRHRLRLRASCLVPGFLSQTHCRYLGTWYLGTYLYACLHGRASRAPVVARAFGFGIERFLRRGASDRWARQFRAPSRARTLAVRPGTR